MSSPANIPFKNIIYLDRLSSTPVYLQIARQMINAIQRGMITAGVELPGTRSLSQILSVHRKTIISAYEELYLQGWIEIRPNKGTFVSSAFHRPDEPESMSADHLVKYPIRSGFAFQRKILLDIPATFSSNHPLEFTDGSPDVRIAPLDKVSRAMSGILKSKHNHRLLRDVGAGGNEFYRETLAGFLNNSRGLPIRKNNILTTRGAHMGIYLTSSLLLSHGDLVIVGKPSYYIANMIFQQAGAKINSVPVDASGISTEAIFQICQSSPPRMVYITPHHHYPTTVTLSTERRIELLKLSEKYGFIILEDDNDYDFHYHSSPLLPLASADHSGMVVYVGAFSTVLAPGLQTGYVVGPEDLISEMSKLRHIVDKHGDAILEQALGELIVEGEIQRHLKKALKIYDERRRLFMQLLSEQLGEAIDFTPPPGGLSLWAEWKKPVNLLQLSRACGKRGLHLPQTLLYQTDKLTGMRLGFGNMNPTELEQAVNILSTCRNL